ncbi:MAG: FmdB family zinc ribbon protein [Rudaea sp.]
MPIYEYCCEDCGTRFELRRSISASDEPAACPECAGKQSKRQVSLFTTMGKNSTQAESAGGGCGCGGACSCGGHSMN